MASAIRSVSRHPTGGRGAARWIRAQVLILAPIVPECASCFELTGFDVIIDEELNPWLLEARVPFFPRLSSGGGRPGTSGQPA